jgi:hypothetical protein
VTFPALPGQKMRTQRVIQGGLVGTKTFGRMICVGALGILAMIGFGVLSFVSGNATLKVLGTIFILGGLFAIWVLAPIIKLHFAKWRER